MIPIKLEVIGDVNWFYPTLTLINYKKTRDAMNKKGANLFDPLVPRSTQAERSIPVGSSQPSLIFPAVSFYPS